MAKQKFNIEVEVWVDDGIYFPADIVEAVEEDAADPHKDEQSMLVKYITKQLNGLAGADVDSVTIHHRGTASTDWND